MISAGVATCPPETPVDASGCRVRTAKGALSGLGDVSVSYTWSYRVGPPTCPSTDLAKPLATTGKLVVAGKGEIGFTVAEGKRCVEAEPLRDEPQDFTITGGTGTYEGASGNGTLDRALEGGRGYEAWAGTIVVPGHEFDVTPPALSGAASKTVRAPKGAKRVRVSYTVTAADATDGKVAATCLPRSGSQFTVGRTRVKCAATDSSANTASASFTVTVKAPR